MIDNLTILQRALSYTERRYDDLRVYNQIYFDVNGCESSVICSELDDLEDNLKYILKLIEQEKQKQGA